MAGGAQFADKAPDQHIGVIDARGEHASPRPSAWARRSPPARQDRRTWTTRLPGSVMGRVQHKKIPNCTHAQRAASRTSTRLAAQRIGTPPLPARRLERRSHWGCPGSTCSACCGPSFLPTRWGASPVGSSPHPSDEAPACAFEPIVHCGDECSVRPGWCFSGLAHRDRGGQQPLALAGEVIDQIAAGAADRLPHSGLHLVLVRYVECHVPRVDRSELSNLSQMPCKFPTLVGQVAVQS